MQKINVEGYWLMWYVIIITMVNLLSGSGINQAKYPTSFDWDTLVRKHHHTYQELIDAQTYRLQRIQRGLLVLDT